MSINHSITEEVMRLCDVKAKVKLGKTTIYKMMKEGRFPKSTRLHDKGVAYWKSSDINQWINKYILEGFAEQQGANHV